MGFLVPWFLVGLAALGIPIFVHLLRRHVTTPRPVSSLMFFERGIQSSTRHKRLRYLLLFALRFLLLLLIVLAFAQPFIRRFADDSRGHLLLIVVDRSFSMRAGTRFADAKQQALTLLANKPHSQQAQILALGGRVEVLTQPSPDSNLLRSTLESIQVGDGQGNYGDMGRTVRTLNEATPGPVDLHLFSDMQRTGMPGNFADAVLPQQVSLTLHDVTKGTASANWTVESINAPVEVLDPKDTTQSHVQAVIASSNAPEATKKVSLVVDGKTLLSRDVKIPPNGRATIDFAPLDIKYGFNRCVIRIEDDDALRADNDGVFVVRRSDPQRVLFVHRPADDRSALYFGAALNAASQGALVLQSVDAEQVTDLDPGKFAFTVLSDVTSLPSIFEHTLEQYLAKGGSVFMALGLDAGRRGHLPLWGGDVKRIHSSEDSTTVGQVDFTYPGLQQIQPGRDNGGWANAKFLYAVVVDPTHARVAARLSDGTPLLLEKTIGEGHLLLFASGFENLTNDLPLHPVFVSFVDKTSRYLSGIEQLSGMRMVDSFVQLRNAPETSKSDATTSEVIDPDGRRPLSLADSQKAQTFRLSRSGFYQIHFANGRSAVIGVNPDRRESNLEAMSQETRALWTGGNAGEPEGEKTPVAVTKYRYVSLWWYVMLLAFVVAVMETLFSTRYLGTQREEL